MHHLLLLYEVAGVLHEVQHLGDAIRPAVQAVRIALALAEAHGAGRPVNLRVDKLRAHQLGELRLGLLVIQPDELAEAPRVDLLVVLRDDLDVVLHHALPEHVPPRGGAFVRSLLEDRMALNLGLMGERPSSNLLPQEDLHHSLEDRHLVQLLGLELVELVQHVVLLVVVLCQCKVERMRSQCRFPLSLVCLHAGRVEDGQVTLANIEVPLLMEPITHHVLVVLDLQVLEFFLFQELGVYLLADDLRPHVVLFQKHQAHLVQDVLGLLPRLHGTEGLHLNLLQEVCSFLGVAVGLLHARQHLREACLFDLHEDLALRDVVERRDELELPVPLQGAEPAHGQVHHVRDRAPQLPALLRQQHDVLLELGPLLGVEVELADLAEELGSRDAVGGHAALLLQHQELLHRLLKAARLAHGLRPCQELLRLFAVVLRGLRIIRQAAEDRVQVLRHGCAQWACGAVAAPG
mmetsp:Transcript_86343/g.279573  ORF Transcript_86343/g.279573 Transcript_86343/m.279573 type:complete len:463 (-) Transcript_86343:96-1484(-)